jgi:hypothetical protein
MPGLSRHGIKRVTTATCALCTALALSTAWSAEGLPQRNLVVSWRVVEAGQARTVGRGAGGYTVSTGTLGGEALTEQQVVVLNGGRARLFVGRTQPYTVWQWAWNGSAGQAGQPAQAATAGAASAVAQPGVQAWAQTAYLDLGQGMTVRPRWAGGAAPVRVELEVRSRQAGGTESGRYGMIEPDGQPGQVQQRDVATTLSVPLGQWAVVARSGPRAHLSEPGTVSTRELDAQQGEQLELRVSLP